MPFTYKWDPNMDYHSGQSGPESIGNEGVLHIFQTPKLVPHHPIEF